MLKEIFYVSNYPLLGQNQGFFQKLLSVIKTYALLFIAIFLSAPVFLTADKLVVIIFHHASLAHQNKQTFDNAFKKLGFLPFLFFVCVAGPVFEEIIFRLLLSFKKQHIVISLLVGLFYFGGVLFHIKNRVLRIEIECAIAAVIIGASLIFIPKTTISLSPLNKRRMIVLSICLFGLMHVFNYIPIDWALVWIYPVFVIPQLLMGWGISYIRFKNGFLWGILLHCIINTVSVVLSYH